MAQSLGHFPADSRRTALDTRPNWRQSQRARGGNSHAATTRGAASDGAPQALCTADCTRSPPRNCRNRWPHQAERLSRLGRHRSRLSNSARLRGRVGRRTSKPQKAKVVTYGQTGTGTGTRTGDIGTDPNSWLGLTGPDWTAFLLWPRLPAVRSRTRLLPGNAPPAAPRARAPARCGSRPAPRAGRATASGRAPLAAPPDATRSYRSSARSPARRP